MRRTVMRRTVMRRTAPVVCRRTLISTPPLCSTPCAPRWTLPQWRTALTDACALPAELAPHRPPHLAVYSYCMGRWLDRRFDHGDLASTKHSAVLFLFQPPEDINPSAVGSTPTDLCFPLTMRTAHMRTHANQMALPGGRCDPNETVIETAMRETHEEIGVDPGDYEILGALPKVWSYPGKCWVTPVVGMSNTPLEHKVHSPDEVSALFYGRMDPVLFHSSQTHFRLEKMFTKSWGGQLTMPCFIVPPTCHDPYKVIQAQPEPQSQPPSCGDYGNEESGTGTSSGSGSDWPEKPSEGNQRADLEAFCGGEHELMWGLTALMFSNLLARLSHSSIANVQLQPAPVVFADPEAASHISG